MCKLEPRQERDSSADIVGGHVPEPDLGVIPAAPGASPPMCEADSIHSGLIGLSSTMRQVPSGCLRETMVPRPDTFRP